MDNKMAVYYENKSLCCYYNGKKVKVKVIKIINHRVLEDGSYRIAENGDRRVLE